MIFFFKVGNGHCSYVEFPNGKNGLIDVKVSTENNDDNIVEILKKAKKISRIDYLFVTHPHRDHIGGLKELVANFNIGTFIYSPIYFKPSPVYEDWNIYEEMKQGYYCKEAHAAKQGQYIVIGNCKINFLAPFDDLLENQPENVNNNGLLLRITCRGHRIIIPGDIEEDGWNLVNDQDIKNTALLLASHHGNNSGYNLQKIKVMNLAFVVISTGLKTEHDADQKYRNQVRKGVYTTRQKRVVAKIDQNNVLSIWSKKYFQN